MNDKIATRAAKNTSVSAFDEELDVFADAGKGSEEVGSKDVVIPRLKLAQALNDEVNKRKTKYIPDLEPGLIFNSATKKIYGPDCLIVPVRYQVRYVEWKTRSNGGGLVNPNCSEADYEKAEEQEGTSARKSQSGQEIVRTPEHFVFVVDPSNGDYEPAVLSMSGSKNTVSKQLNTAIRNIKIVNPKTNERVEAPRFYTVFGLGAAEETSDKGDYFNFTVQKHKFLKDMGNWAGDVYRAAKEFNEMVAEGAATAEIENPNEGGSSHGIVEDDLPI